MPLSAHHEQLLDYDDWANREVLAALRGLAAPPPRAVKLLNHVVGASLLWLARLQERPAPCAVWPAWGLAECAAEAVVLRTKWRTWTDATFGAAHDAVANAALLTTTIAYQNSKGERHSSRIDDVLTHVAMHGVHHRAQILAELRAAGHAPPYLDFIHATRTGCLAT